MNILLLCLALQAPTPEARQTFVSDLVAPTLSAEELRGVSEEVRSELSRFKELKVLAPSDIERMLEVAAEQQAMGCDTASCLSEVASALGAELLVTGNLLTVGATTQIQLQLVDATKAEVIRRTSLPVSKDLLASARAAARQLMAVKGIVQLLRQVPGADVFVADEHIGKTPLDAFGVKRSGPVMLRVEHHDYLPYETTVDVTPGKLTRHVLRVQSYADLESAAEQRAFTGSTLAASSGVLVVGAGAMGLWSGLVAADYAALDPRTSQDVFDDRARESIATGVASGVLAAGAIGAGVTAGYLLLVTPERDLLDGVGALE